MESKIDGVDVESIYDELKIESLDVIRHKFEVQR